jgi:alpha-glucosidase
MRIFYLLILRIIESVATTAIHVSRSTLDSGPSDTGADLTATIDDPNAVNAQKVCPGYKASDVANSSRGLTAILKLAGEPCNAYGVDVESLNLTVEFQSEDRLNIHIFPTNIASTNSTWYTLPETLVPRPQSEDGAFVSESDLSFTWSNDPSFNFHVTRKSTGDSLFSTKGTILVFENQFINFPASFLRTIISMA